MGRRLTLDPGLRFHRVGDLYSAGATLVLFRKEEYDSKKAGQLIFPSCSIATTPIPPRSAISSSRRG